MEKYTPGKLTAFFSKYTQIAYKKGETILRSDDKPQGVYYIKEGFVKLNTLFADGRELTFNIYKPGTYFPMMWAIGDIPNSYFYITQTATKVHRAPKKAVLGFLKENPEVLFELTRRILVGLDGILSNIEYALCGNSYRKVVGAIFLFSKRFGVTGKDGRIILKIPFSHQDISNIAGISRETASITLKKLERKKIISYKKRHIVIENIKVLEDELGAGNKEEKVPYIA